MSTEAIASITKNGVTVTRDPGGSVTIALTKDAAEALTEELLWAGQDSNPTMVTVWEGLDCTVPGDLTPTTPVLPLAQQWEEARARLAAHPATDTLLHQAGLPVRLVNACCNRGEHTLAYLASLSWDDLRDMRMIGDGIRMETLTRVNEILEATETADAPRSPDAHLV